MCARGFSLKCFIKIPLVQCMCANIMPVRWQLVYYLYTLPSVNKLIFLGSPEVN